MMNAKFPLKPNKFIFLRILIFNNKYRRTDIRHQKSAQDIIIGRLSDSNLSMDPVKKVFCLQMQIKSCVTLFSWQVRKSIWRNFPTRLQKKRPSKVLFVSKKMRRLFGHSRAKIVIFGSGKWVKNHHFCAQLSHSFSQHRLAQFSTSVSVGSGDIYWATKRRCPMSHVRSLMSDVWCAMSDVWWLISDVWCLLSDSVPRVRYMMSDGWCLFFDVRCPIFDVRSPMSDDQCLVSDVWCPMCDCVMSDVWCLMSDVKCLKSNVRRLLSPFRIW